MEMDSTAMIFSASWVGVPPKIYQAAKIYLRLGGWEKMIHLFPQLQR